MRMAPKSSSTAPMMRDVLIGTTGTLNQPKWSITIEAMSCPKIAAPMIVAELMLARAPVELADTEVAVGQEGAHLERARERLGLAIAFLRGGDIRRLRCQRDLRMQTFQTLKTHRDVQSAEGRGQAQRVAQLEPLARLGLWPKTSRELRARWGDQMVALTPPSTGKQQPVFQ